MFQLLCPLQPSCIVPLNSGAAHASVLSGYTGESLACAVARRWAGCRRWRGAVSGVVCKSRVAGIVHFLPVARIKSLRTPHKSGLWPEVNGWLWLVQWGS